ncbi:MAG: DUF2000 family protein [Alphaproteobacteria bacterium]|nr:DUF2000 family protein [Alphaproteobacteria bacterium]
MDEITLPHETKIVVVVRNDLETWQKLNVASFLAGGLAGADPSLVGEPYRDATGSVYHPLMRQPILIYAGSLDDLRLVHRRAMDRDVRLAIYTKELFATSNDVANRNVVEAVERDDLNLVGLAFHTERRVADKIVKGLKWHA